MRNLLLILAAVAFTASTASAVPTVGIYFDGGMTETSGTIEPFVNSDLYIVLSGIQGGAAGIQYELVLPAEISVVAHDYSGGLALSPATGSYEVGFPACQVLGTGTPSYVVDRFTVTALVEFGPAPMDLGPCTSCNDSSGATAPRYATCNSSILDLQVETGTIGAASVPVSSESFGAVKALFGE